MGQRSLRGIKLSSNDFQIDAALKFNFVVLKPAIEKQF